MTILISLPLPGDSYVRRLVSEVTVSQPLGDLYSRVDDREVFRIVRSSLGDFDDYLVSIGRYLKAEL